MWPKVRAVLAFFLFFLTFFYHERRSKKHYINYLMTEMCYFFRTVTGYGKNRKTACDDEFQFNLFKENKEKNFKEKMY